MDNYTLHRGRLIDHIQLVVNNFAASKAFYTAVLAELKIPVVITDDGYIWADELVISSVKSSESGGVPTGRHHLAFQATDRESVNAFYHAALNHGGRDNGAPAERTYHPGYYAAFVLDPDGNNIEAVYHGEGDRSASSVEISFTV
ncbi:MULTISPECIES: VOC family protein [Enterobacteriaceae]|uniref:VOC family protein n=1 Tax=Enterobacteriaceae TaxID=543 RepID=UPI00254E0E30|nr:VOC family protein [Citrobacter freundii]MDK8078199.1 VOC family protein [Citrobacter freundii]MDK8589124.1 VOC family protein [Citrobacter freundii]HEB0904396.1 VOC family protein [Citrobacter freundii]HEB0909116.1 VOC family protein [Citrobacter freundii]